MDTDQLLSTDELLSRARSATGHLTFNGRVDPELTERTLRYYLSMRYLSPSLHRDGRRAWTEDHVRELIASRQALSAGRSLRDIGNEKAGGTDSSWRSANRGSRGLSGAIGARTSTTQDTALFPGLTSTGVHANESGSGRVIDTRGWSIALSHNVVISGFTAQEPNQPELEKVVAALSRILTPDNTKEDNR